jgi:hydrogenase 3 maturation protease
VHTFTRTAPALNTRLPKINPQTRLAILGIGSELRCDDAAGVMVARRLMSRLPERPNLLILDTGAVPESFTGPVRRFDPEIVLLVDAADMGLEPGGVGVVEWHEAGGLSASTHTLPVPVVAQYLQSELNCRVFLVGLQPHKLEFLEKMTPAGHQAVETAVNGLIRWLKSGETSRRERKLPVV